ncbi:alpha/beta fold hydrolase [Micromonospora sp. 15K316]|uniref:alpha/beta fold hydrolase n=1 Tax=Micromonospora sp. 15K316 TaxID=2530376 RepID=UPI001050E357|nr:alpha/beta fold hydrolase [Micromonospora sp. 15K316]TDC37126.1 alpha/beta fold hydrolase [Micromonospora sp. 15K316]
MTTAERPRHVTVAGRRVRHRIDGVGEPVVLLHGIGRSMRDFAEQHDLLAERFRVHSVDLPGYGGSLPMVDPYNLPSLARFVGRYLDAVGVHRPAHLVGSSLGGAIAMQLAVTERHRVASLALVGSAGFGREVTLALRLLTLRPLGRMMLLPSRAAVRRTELALFHDPAFATAERIAHALELARLPYTARVMLETARSLGRYQGVREEWRARLLARMAELEVPTLVVWGERDRVLPAAHLEAARAALPAARTHLFPDCGHLPQIERAEEFHRLLLDFWGVSVPAGERWMTATGSAPDGASTAGG